MREQFVSLVNAPRPRDAPHEPDNFVDDELIVHKRVAIQIGAKRRRTVAQRQKKRELDLVQHHHQQ
jgi:hypothetical protein